MRDVSFAAGPVALNVVTGESAGPPVVLLHGVMRRGLDWLTVWPALAARWRVHAPDFRGHGGSARTPGAYRIADYVPDLVALVRSLDEPAVLIGHSLGGNVAAAVAAEAPDRVRALVLEDPPLGAAGTGLPGSFTDLFRGFRPHAGSTRPVRQIAAELAEVRLNGPGGVRSLGSVRDAASLRFSAACLRHLDPGVLDPPLAGSWLDGSDVPATLSRIACPTLLLQADPGAGGILDDAHADAMAAWLTDGTRIKLPGFGHNLHATQSDAFLRLVLPFLASID